MSKFTPPVTVASTKKNGPIILSFIKPNQTFQRTTQQPVLAAAIVLLLTVTPHKKLRSLLRSYIFLLVTAPPHNGWSGNFKLTE
jgi:hypothetical protein